jgi:predicted DNA-binding protein YlxM (UPF0122 family)
MSTVNKLRIYNLCDEFDLPFKTIERIYLSTKKSTLNQSDIIEALPNTPTREKILNAFSRINQKYTSLYALSTIGINFIIIDKLKETFKSLEDLLENPTLLKKYSFQVKTYEKIMDFIKSIDNENVDNKTMIINKLLFFLESALTPKSKDDLIKLIHEEVNGFSPNDFYDALNEMIHKNQIQLQSEGFVLNRLSIDEYILSNKNDKSVQILKFYLDGLNYREIGIKFKVSRQRIEQIIKKTLEKFPVFKNEFKYFSLIKEYDLRIELLNELGFKDLTLINYLKLKYELNPKKNEIDYLYSVVKDNPKILDSESSKKILQLNKKVFINGKFLDLNFRVLFDEFIKEDNIRNFNSKIILPKFKDYLEKRLVSLDVFENSFEVLDRKILNHRSYLSCGSYNYYFFEKSFFNEEFLNKTRNYFENFYGYGSVNYFLYRNKELCHSLEIYNEYVLFSVLKTLYSEEFQNDVEFIRMPTIISKNLNIDDFIKELISELQPLSINDLLKYLSENFGLKKESIYANKSDFLSSFLDSNGLLTSNENKLINELEDTKKIIEIINHKKIIPTQSYKNIIKDLYPEKISSYTTPTFVRKIDYSFRNDCIYMKQFSSFFDACISLSKDLPMSINIQTLAHFFPLKDLDSRYSIFKQECIFLRYSDNSFLNIDKRIPREVVIKFRDELLDSIPENNIFTLEDLLDSNFYKNIIYSYTEIHNLIEAMNERILVSILQSSLKITYLESNTKFVFSKGNLISNKQIILSLVKKQGSIERNELSEVLNNKYGIDNTYPASYFIDLGLHFDSYTNKVYDSKSRADEELQYFLEKGEN